MLDIYKILDDIENKPIEDKFLKGVFKTLEKGNVSIFKFDEDYFYKNVLSINNRSFHRLKSMNPITYVGTDESVKIDVNDIDKGRYPEYPVFMTHDFKNFYEVNNLSKNTKRRYKKFIILYMLNKYIEFPVNYRDKNRIEQHIEAMKNHDCSTQGLKTIISDEIKRDMAITDILRYPRTIHMNSYYDIVEKYKGIMSPYDSISIVGSKGNYIAKYGYWDGSMEESKSFLGMRGKPIPSIKYIYYKFTK